MTGRPQGHDSRLLRDAAQQIRDRFGDQVSGLDPEILLRALTRFLEQMADNLEEDQRLETSRRWQEYRAELVSEQRAAEDSGRLIRPVRVRGYVGTRVVYTAVEVPLAGYSEAVRQEALARFRKKYPYALNEGALLIDYIAKESNTP